MFYNYKKATSVKQKKEEYNSFSSLFELYEILLKVFDIDTCAPRLRNQYRKENPSLGHCSIVSFLVQDIFGGEVYGVPLLSGGYHCFNYIEGVIFDLTSEQFIDEKLNYTLDYKQNRETHFKDNEKYNRYLLLKQRLKKY